MDALFLEQHLRNIDLNTKQIIMQNEPTEELANASRNSCLAMIVIRDRFAFCDETDTFFYSFKLGIPIDQNPPEQL